MFLDASDYDCVYESTYVNIYQHEGYRDENDFYQQRNEIYDLEIWNTTHFSDQDFQDIPALNEMEWLSSNFSVSGSAYSK